MVKIIITTLYLLLLLTSNSFAQNSLQDYVEEAKKNSPLIIDNQNQKIANQLEIERLKAFYTKPQVSVTANYLFAPIVSQNNNKTKFEANTNGADNYYGYDLAASNGGQYQALLNLTQPLFNGERAKTYSEQVNVNSLLNQNTINLAAHDVEKLVTDQYVLCLQDRKQTEYAAKMINILKDQQFVIQKLVESGIYKQSDLTLINIEFQNFLGLLNTYSATYRRDLMDLNVISGIGDTALVMLEDIDLQLKTDSADSHFLDKYKIDSLNLTAIQKVFELKYKPQLSLYANTGLNAVYIPTILQRFGFNAGIMFTYNLFDGGQKNITRKKTTTLLSSVSAYKQNFVTVNEVRKTRFHNELKSYESRIAIMTNQLSQYEILLSAYKKEVMTGQLSIINFINTLKNMSLVQRDFALLTTQRQLLINAYNYWNW